MNGYQFLKQLFNVKVGGDGIKRDVHKPIRDFFLNSDGSALTTTLTTNPGYVVAGNQQLLRWNAAIVVAAGLTLQVPGDYDETADDFRVRVLAVSGGTADSPAVTLAGYRQRQAVTTATALTSKTGVIPQGEAGYTAAGAARTVPLSTTGPKWLEFNLSGQGLKANDVLNLNLVPAAHATDTVNVFTAVARYKGGIVLFAETER